MKTALITGICGQDGSYLAEHLLSLGYRVYGLMRKPPFASVNIRSLLSSRDINFEYGDMLDALALETVFRKANPDEVYNLAAQVFVPTSWTSPVETFDVNVGGLARLLKIVEQVKPDTRVYQASSSEMYGNSNGVLDEDSPFAPVSPYGVSKLAAHKLCDVYRQRGLYVAAGILFNHESPRRGSEMVTRKISLAVAHWAHGGDKRLKLGNVSSRRDWGFAGDYVKAMHLMLQQEKPKDFVIATGESHSVKDFLDEALLVANTLACGLGKHLIEVDPQFVRTNEIHNLVGDCNMATKELGWKPQVSFKELVRMMVESDYARR